MRTSLKILVVHEDAEAGSGARRLVERLDADVKSEIRLESEAWGFRTLAEERHFAESTEKAVEAGMIILAAHNAEGIPEHIRNWIETWVSHQHGDAAIVVLIDEPEYSHRPSSFRTSLSRMAHQNEVDVFWRNGAAGEGHSSRPKTLFHSRHHRPFGSALADADGVAEREWGIND